MLGMRGVGQKTLCPDAMCAPSKNFQANHQLDVDLWTEFPCMFWRQDGASRVSFSAPFKFQLTVLRKPLVVVGW